MMVSTLIGLGIFVIVVAYILHLTIGVTADDNPVVRAVINALVTLHMGLYIAAGVHATYWFITEGYPEWEWWQAANLNFAIFVLIGIVGFFVVYSVEKREKS